MNLKTIVGVKADAINLKLSKIQTLTGKNIKIAATIFMFLDHFCKIVCQWYLSSVLMPMAKTGQISAGTITKLDEFIRFHLYPIGAIAFPLFCFLITEGFIHSRNRKKYFLTMVIFAFLSELPFDISFFHDLSHFEGTFPFYWKYQNVFFTLTIGIAALFCIEWLQQTAEKSRCKYTFIFLQIICAFTFAGFAELIRSDYGGYGVFLIVVFYLVRNNRIYQIVSMMIVFILSTGNQPAFSEISAALFIALYNGTRGKIQRKYAFYAFYPIHIFALYTITWF